jgi:hypothetical protein
VTSNKGAYARSCKLGTRRKARKLQSKLRMLALELAKKACNAKLRMLALELAKKACNAKLRMLALQLAKKACNASFGKGAR